ncbi:Hypothetical protein, putative [Bodo saltans]|uniref:Uncharacterized protein n=1 Tax=Bodo saltans TaxID=75058 RepID=A0A0S4J9B9_BODSA|nr:Hypothetical protein, putative [Bodo saltans]|eukprot:CUG87078.1 Hypothetical protein, putative [Bodo saltans]
MSKLLSVIVAGGTGSTGREVVSKLVAHPKVGRVVVLSRYAIPVNRWQTFFPNIRTSDALRHLSIVDVNWHKMYEDTSAIQLNSLIDGGDCSECENPEAWPLAGAPSSSSSTTPPPPSLIAGPPQSSYLTEDERGRELDSAGWHRYDDRDAANPSSSSTSVATMDNEEELEGLNHHNQSKKHLFHMTVAAAAAADAAESSHSSSSKPDTAQRKLRRTLHALSSSTYYRSIFSGHHVAINCLGSHNLLNPWGVNAVDHNFAIAFAKLVRVFNCYLEDRDAEAIADEMEALRESAKSVNYDANLWAEVCAAYLGNTSQRNIAIMTAKAPTSVAVDSIDAFLHDLSTSRRTSSMRSTTAGALSAIQQRRPTLLHYAQVSAAGASPRSPLPYFSAHGACDEETTRLFCTPPPTPPSVEAAANTTPKQLVGHRFINPLSLDIYKPSLLKRPNARWWEKGLQLFAPPVSVEALSSMIVDDVLRKSEVFFANPNSASAPSTAAVSSPQNGTAAANTAAAAAEANKKSQTPERSVDTASVALLARWQRLTCTDRQSPEAPSSAKIIHSKEISWRAQKYELRKQRAAAARLEEY